MCHPWSHHAHAKVYEDGLDLTGKLTVPNNHHVYEDGLDLTLA